MAQLLFTPLYRLNQIYCFLSLLIIIIYIIVSASRNFIIKNRLFYPSYIEVKKQICLMFFIILTQIFVFFLNTEYIELYSITWLLLIQYIVANGRLYLNEDTNIILIYYFKVYIFSLRYRKFISATLLALCLLLIYLDSSSLINTEINRELLLFSLMSFGFIALFILLIKLFIFDFEMYYLKVIEKRIITNDTEIDDIEELFSIYFVGDKVSSEIDNEFQKHSDLLDLVSEADQKFELLKKQGFSLPSINELLSTLLEEKEILKKAYIAALNQQANFIYIRLPTHLKKQDSIVLKISRFRKVINRQILEARKIKHRLIKKEGKKSR